MLCVIALLFVLLLYAVGKWISYYATVLGLIYYVGEKHNDMMDGEKLRELRDYALQRRIKELTGHNAK